MKYGLIGGKLGHSYSKTLHALLADYAYDLYPMPPEELPRFMARQDMCGFNVTIPYKQDVIPYLAEMSDTAREIGSVNTVLRRPDGSLFGDNTDAYGFTQLIRSIGMEPKGVKTLVLGSGGTSRTACCVIRSLGGTPVVISRGGENNYDNLSLHRDAAYIVNTTPVGMYPATDQCPVDISLFPALRGVVDVIYNPMRTRLVQNALDRGIPAVGGLKMLVYQAVRAAEQFSLSPISKEKAQAAEAALRENSLNLVLVGMPGCGKTTVGKLLSQLLQKEYVDLDQEIEKAAGISIPEIFAREGEEGFRNRESEVLQRFCDETGRILLTGGGAVKRGSNRFHLRKNGFVVMLQRDLSLLATEGRPLSKDAAALKSMWQERKPLYEAAADAVIENDDTPARCAEKIREAWHETLRS